MVDESGERRRDARELGRLDEAISGLKTGQTEIKALIRTSISEVHDRLDKCQATHDKRLGTLETGQAVQRTKLGAIVAGISVAVALIVSVVARLASHLWSE